MSGTKPTPGPTDADVEAMALLPCPFCSGEAIVINHRWSGNNEIKAYYVHCIKCNANGHGRNTKEKAIAAWNRRTIPPHYTRAVEEREGLIAALEAIHGRVKGPLPWDKAEALRARMIIEDMCRTALSRAQAPTPVAGEGETK